jgi:hypothetical protein
MAKGLRHEDPRCGREHFDLRAGIDWERGPSPNETADSTPDTPWNQKSGSKLLFEKGRWAVTDFGLEPLTHVQELWENYKIPGCELLAPALPAEMPWPDFNGFEEMFRKAIQVHCVPLLQGIENDITELRRQMQSESAALHRRLSREFEIIKKNVRMIGSIFHDTEGEITVLHEDVDRVRARLANLEARVEEVERRLCCAIDLPQRGPSPPSSST